MSESDTTHDKDQQDLEEPRPTSTGTTPGQDATAPADAQRVADQDEEKPGAGGN